MLKNNNKKVIGRFFAEISHKIYGSIISQENLNNIIYAKTFFGDNNINFYNEMKSLNEYFEYSSMLNIKLDSFKNEEDKEKTISDYVKNIVKSMNEEDLVNIDLMKEDQTDLLNPLIEYLFYNDVGNLKKIMEKINLEKGKVLDKNKKNLVNKLYANLEKKDIFEHVELVSKNIFKKRI